MIIIGNKPEARYRVIEVAKALGLSEHAVSGYFNNRGTTTKNGLTLDQIYALCLARRRGDVDWNAVHDIRHALAVRYGVEIVEAKSKDDD